MVINGKFFDLQEVPEVTDKNAEIFLGITLQCSPMIIVDHTLTFGKFTLDYLLGIWGVPTIIHANSFGVATIIRSIQEF